MPKRFTATEKWLDPWFCELRPLDQLFWVYILDHCDISGLWEPNWKIVYTYFGTDYYPDKEAFKKKVVILPSGKWFIPNFLYFQQEVCFNPKNPTHIGIARRLHAAGINEEIISTIEGPRKDLVRTYIAPIKELGRISSISISKSISKSVNRKLPNNGITNGRIDTPFQVFMNRCLKEFFTIDLTNKAAVDAGYRRYGRAARDILAFASGDPEKAYQGVDAIADYMQNKGLTWTLDTAAKWFPDWLNGGLKNADKAEKHRIA